jgi:hypothetical protein
VSDGLLQPNELLVERSAVGTESPGRDWIGIGVGLVAAFALIAILLAGVWGFVVLMEATA